MRRILFIALAAVLSIMLPGGAYAMTASTSSSGASAVLNSNTNSSSYGNADEASFLRVKNANSPNPGFTNGTIDVNSDALLMQAFVSNSSAANAARNVSLTITLPTGPSASQTAAATLRSDNAGTLSDEVKMVDSQPFGLQFDQGAQVFIAKRSGSGDNNYVNSATSNFRINGNVMTVDMGDWIGGVNQQGLVTVRVLVTRSSVQPAFACTGLSRSAIDNNRSTFTASSNGAAAGANITGYTFTVKDSSGRVVDTFNANTSAQSGMYTFNQSNSGTYAVTAVANSDKGTTAATSACAQTVTVPAVLSATTSATTTNNSSKPAALPNTGAGDVLGIFSGASVAGGAGHYLLRRFRR